MKYKVLMITALFLAITAMCNANGVDVNEHTYCSQFLHYIFIAIKILLCLCVLLAPLAIPIGGFYLIMYGLDSMFNPGCHEKDRLRKAKEKETRKRDLVRKITEKIAWKN